MNRTNEYNQLRDELKMRISIMEKNTISVYTLIISIWTILGAGVVAFLTNYNKCCFDDKIVAWVIGFIMIILLLPNIFLYLSSIKQRENLIQIISIGSYIRLFYEFKTIKDKKDFFAWESFQKLNKKDFGFNYFGEYVFFPALSLIGYVICVIKLFNYTSNRFVFWVFAFLILLLLIYTCVFIVKNTNPKTIIREQDKFDNYYCIIAKDQELFTKYEIEEYLKFMKYIQSMQNYFKENVNTKKSS